MKKFIFAVCFLSVATSVQAGSIWGLIKNSDLEKRDSKQIAIEVKGVNIRAYIFDVPEMKSICISTFADNNHQMECKTYKEMGLKNK